MEPGLEEAEGPAKMEPGSGRHGASKDAAWVRKGRDAMRYVARASKSRNAGTDVEE